MPTKTGSDRPRGALGSRTSAMTPETLANKGHNRVTAAKVHRNRNRVQSQARSKGRARR